MNILKDSKLLSMLDRTYQLTLRALEAHMAQDENELRKYLPTVKSMCGELSQRIYEIDCIENYKEDEYF